uniref:Desiccation-related protein PCC13-62 n=1 Tax=Oryza punctata TaxID=4537 RepID=A0A0E0KDM3_ORYPU
MCCCFTINSQEAEIDVQKNTMNNLSEMASPRICCSVLLVLLLVSSCNAVGDPACPPAWSAAVAEEVLHGGGGGAQCRAPAPHTPVAVFAHDVDPVQFALNLEYTEAEFFLHAAFGEGLDHFAPNLTLGGPPPVGATKASLDELTWRVCAEFSYQEIGHLRAIQKTVGAILRPQIDLSAHNFARVMDEAIGYHLDPPFDPYTNSLNFLLAVYVIPYLGINGYTGTNPLIDGYATKRLVAGLLAVESGQDAVVRGLLFERRHETVAPYHITVAEFTDRVSALRNRLGQCGVKDEGLIVPKLLGAEGKICTNILSANTDSLSYSRTPAELLRILYLTGDEHVPGGFFPKGANGRIARKFLNKPPRVNHGV